MRHAAVRMAGTALGTRVLGLSVGPGTGFGVSGGLSSGLGASVGLSSGLGASVGLSSVLGASVGLSSGRGVSLGSGLGDAWAVADSSRLGDCLGVDLSVGVAF